MYTSCVNIGVNSWDTPFVYMSTYFFTIHVLLVTLSSDSVFNCMSKVTTDISKGVTIIYSNCTPFDSKNYSGFTLTLSKYIIITDCVNIIFLFKMKITVPKFFFNKWEVTLRRKTKGSNSEDRI